MDILDRLTNRKALEEKLVKGPDAINDMKEAAIQAGINKQKQSDPLIAEKIAGKEIIAQLLATMKNEKGVHAESLFCALGALAGYACQASVRAQALAQGLEPDAPFIVVKTKDEQQYYYLGDALNAAVAEGHLSIWNLAAGAAQHAGAKSLTNTMEIFDRVSKSLGTADFGKPKYPGNPANDLPINYLNSFWALYLPHVRKRVGAPTLWPVAFAFAIQEAIAMAKDTVAPETALTIVMEAAIPMSKVRLNLPSASNEEVFKQLLEQGGQFATSGKYHDAVSCFNKVILCCEEIYREEKVKLFCARWITESLMYMTEAANSNAAAKIVSILWAYAYYSKGYSLIELGHLSEGKDALDRALALSPRNSQFLSELGSFYQREKNWLKAYETFQAAESAAKEFSPPEQKSVELSRAWRGLGFIYVEQRKLDEAEQMYRQCLELDPADSRAVNELHYVQDLYAKEDKQ